MRTAMAIINKYGEIVCELEPKGGYFYRIPCEELERGFLLCEGDVFTVEAVEIED